MTQRNQHDKEAKLILDKMVKGALLSFSIYLVISIVAFLLMTLFAPLGENPFAYLFVYLAVPGGIVLTPFSHDPAFENFGMLMCFVITSILLAIFGAIVGMIVGWMELPWK